MNVFVFLQEGLNSTAALAEMAPPAEVRMNVLDLAMKGGWIMLPIVLLFFVSLGIFIERLLVIRQASQESDSFMERIRDYMSGGRVDAAKGLCQKTHTPYARMIEKGILRLGRPLNDVQVAIENVGTVEVAKLEKGFPWLATTAAIAPMLGFLGTVTGMVRAFFTMATAGSNVDISLLSSGIYEALVTTVAGLSVGIPALFAYNYLVSKVDGVIAKMEARTVDFMDILNEPVDNS
jgi:biopolymer transport protein ExbB